jgi:hypothetical protein
MDRDERRVTPLSITLKVIQLISILLTTLPVEVGISNSDVLLTFVDCVRPLFSNGWLSYTAVTFTQAEELQKLLVPRINWRIRRPHTLFETASELPWLISFRELQNKIDLLHPCRHFVCRVAQKSVNWLVKYALKQLEIPLLLIEFTNTVRNRILHIQSTTHNAVIPL